MAGAAGGNPLILDIKGNSLDDGPGIRTVVFFKGCPLSCVWCHNPESKRSGVEISFDAGECVGCDTCMDVCPESALDRANPDFIDRGKCTLCFECAGQCPSGAISRVGRVVAVEEIVSEVKKDMPFFKTSGGGVTLSGGEPTLFMEYCGRLARALRGLGVHTILETCGHFDMRGFEELVHPFIDAVYFDLKLIDPGEHKEQCGVSNELILENFKSLYERYHAGGTEVLPRIPLIPGITATDSNLEMFAGFLREEGAGRVALMPYNPLWIEKDRKVGGHSLLVDRQQMTTWMNPAAVKRCRSIFKGFEVE